VKNDSTYYRQVQDTVGLDSAWTRYHRLATGVDLVPIETRGIATLNLYREAVELLRTTMHPDHLEVAEQAVRVFDEATALMPSAFKFTKKEFEYGTGME
jgi:hypothetical protein